MMSDIAESLCCPSELDWRSKLKIMVMLIVVNNSL